MHRASLHAHVARLHESRLAAVQDKLNLSVDDDAIVHGHRSVHRTCDPRRHIDISEHCAATNHESWRLARIFLVDCEVFVLIHVDWKFLGCVGEVERGIAIGDYLRSRLLWQSVRDDGLARLVMPGSDYRWRREWLW